MIDNHFFSNKDPFFSKKLTFSSSEGLEKSQHSIGDLIQELFKHLRRGWTVYFIPNCGLETLECRIVRKFPFEEKEITKEIEEKIRNFTIPRLKEMVDRSTTSLTNQEGCLIENQLIRLVNSTHLVFSGTVISDSINRDFPPFIIERIYDNSEEKIILRQPEDNDPVIKEFIRAKTLTLLDEEASLSAIVAVLPECNLMCLTAEEQLLFQERIPFLVNMIPSEEEEDHSQALRLLEFFSTIPALTVKSELKNRSTCGVIKKVVERLNACLPNSILAHFIQLTEAATIRSIPSKPWAHLFRDLILHTPEVEDSELFTLFLRKIEIKIAQDGGFSKLLGSILDESNRLTFYSRALLFLNEPFYLHRLLECPYSHVLEGELIPLPEERMKLFNRFFKGSIERKSSSECLELLRYQQILLGIEFCFPNFIVFWETFPKKRVEITEFIEAVVGTKISEGNISIMDTYECLYSLSSIASWLERMEGFVYSDSLSHFEIFKQRFQCCLETKNGQQGLMLLQKAKNTLVATSDLNSYINSIYEIDPKNVFEWAIENSPQTLPSIQVDLFSKNKLDVLDLLVSQLCGEKGRDLPVAIRQEIAKKLIPYLVLGSKSARAILDSAIAYYLFLLDRKDRFDLSVLCANKNDQIHLKLFAFAIQGIEREDLWIPSQSHTVNQEWFLKLVNLGGLDCGSDSLVGRYALCFFESILDNLMDQKKFLELLYPYLLPQQKNNLIELFSRAAEDVDREVRNRVKEVNKGKKANRSLAFTWLTLLPSPLINAFLQEPDEAARSYLSLACSELHFSGKLPEVVHESIQTLIDSNSVSFSPKIIRIISSLAKLYKRSFNFTKLLSACIGKIQDEESSKDKKTQVPYLEFLTVWMAMNRCDISFPIVQGVIQDYLDEVDIADGFLGVAIILSLPDELLKLLNWTRLICIYLRNRPSGLTGLIRKIIRSSGPLHKSIFSLFPPDLVESRLKFKDLVFYFSEEILILEKIEFDDQIACFASQVMENIVPTQGDVEDGEFFVFDSTYTSTLDSHSDAKLLTTSLVRVLLKGGAEYATTLIKFYKACHFIDLDSGGGDQPIGDTIELYLDYVAWIIKYAPKKEGDLKNGLHRIFKYIVENELKLTSNQARMIQEKITALMDNQYNESPVITTLALIFLNGLLISKEMVDDDAIYEILCKSDLALSTFEYAVRLPSIRRNSGIEYTTLSVFSKWQRYLLSCDFKPSREKIERIREVDREITTRYIDEIVRCDQNGIESILGDDDAVALFGNKILYLLSFKLQRSMGREIGFLRDLTREEIWLLLKMLIPLGQSYVERGLKFYIESKKEREEAILKRILQEIKNSCHLNERLRNEMACYLLKTLLI